MCQPGNPSPHGLGHFSDAVVAGGLPQREVGGVALVRVDLELLAVAGPERVERVAGQLARSPGNVVTS